MADGRRREQWQHTSNLLAMIHNTVPGLKRGDMKRASDFNPMPEARAHDADDNDVEVPFDTLKILANFDACRER